MTCTGEIILLLILVAVLVMKKQRRKDGYTKILSDEQVNSIKHRD